MGAGQRAGRGGGRTHYRRFRPLGGGGHRWPVHRDAARVLDGTPAWCSLTCAEPARRGECTASGRQNGGVDGSSNVRRSSIRRYERTMIARQESRLELGAFQLEQFRSRELILRHAPEPPAVVLDVGGAAGAYAFWLAERGYEVHLVDAVPRLIDIARDRNEHATRPLASCRVADARALPDADNTASMVLLLGPLYHRV